MKHYLAIIRKIDFVDLFKFGHFFINNAVPFDDEDDFTDNNDLFCSVTKYLNPYDYSFEYLMIHFVSEEGNNTAPIDVNIQQVKKIYAFDEEAQKEMSISFDPRIEIACSPWSEKFATLHEQLLLKQSYRGVNNLWTLFELTQEDLNKCKKIIPNEAIEEAFRGFYANERPTGELSIWTYLLRYERHSLYPKDMRGFFCDYIHVFCNYSDKREFLEGEAENTNLYKDIMKAENNSKISELQKIVEQSQLNSLANEVAKCRFSVAASLFLYLKSQFSEGVPIVPDKKKIEYAKEFGKLEGAIAVYLLGITLGHDKTYDSFYQNIHLSIFNKERRCSEKVRTDDLSMVRVADELRKNIYGYSEDQCGEISEPFQHSLFESLPEKQCENNTQMQVWVRKYQGPGKDNLLKLVFNEDDLNKCKIERYVKVKQFTEKDRKSIEEAGYDFESVRSGRNISRR